MTKNNDFMTAHRDTTGNEFLTIKDKLYIIQVKLLGSILRKGIEYVIQVQDDKDLTPETILNDICEEV